MKIVPAGSAEIAKLTRLEVASKRASISQLIGPHDLDENRLLRRWETYFLGQSPLSSKPERRVLQATVNGVLVGYIAGHLTSRYDMDAEIQSFYVLRDYQRQGIGSALLGALAAWLVSLRATRLCVGIAAGNPYRAFYEKHDAVYLNEHWLYWHDLQPLVALESPASD